MKNEWRVEVKAEKVRGCIRRHPFQAASTADELSE